MVQTNRTIFIVTLSGVKGVGDLPYCLNLHVKDKHSVDGGDGIMRLVSTYGRAYQGPMPYVHGVLKCL